MSSLHFKITITSFKFICEYFFLCAFTGAPSDASKEEKLAADIAEDRRKLNDTLDSLQSVILERELLHKQQQLEKQQQQLQLELQKHVVATAEANGKASVPKTSDVKTAESKSTDSKMSEVKATVNKNADGNKKKGKKKPGRQAAGKQEAPEEIKPEVNESEIAVAPSEEIAPSESPAPSKPNPSGALSPSGEAADVDLSVTPEAVVKPAESSAPAVSAVAVEENLEPNADSPASPKTETPLEGRGTQVASLTQSASVPAPEPTNAPANAPATFSYAAAVGSKQSEHPVTDKPQTDKTEDELADLQVQTATPESAAAPISASLDVPSPAEATNGVARPVGNDKAAISNENTSSIAPSPPKKGKVNDIA